MSWLNYVGLLLGSVVTLPRWARMPHGVPPTDYTIRTQPELLSMFSDDARITPRSMRDFVASTVTTNPGGGPCVVPIPLPGWTTAGRPTGLVGPAVGYNYDLRQLDLWDDSIGEWVNPSFSGGVVSGDTIFAGKVAVVGDVKLEGNVSIPHLHHLPHHKSTGDLYRNGPIVSIIP